MSSAVASKSLTVHVLAGTGTAKVPAELFGEPFHGALVHEVVQAEQAARRRGTAATLTRGRVRGGGKKPWRQKGTGRARIGSIRAPHWTGGGVVFGPTPRRYTVKVNRKARRRALRSVLSLHAGRKTLAVVEVEAFKEPSTRQASEALKSWDGAGRSALVLVGADELTCMKSFRNLESTAVKVVADAGVVDIIKANSLVVSKAAVEWLTSAGLSGKIEKAKGAAS